MNRTTSPPTGRIVAFGAAVAVTLLALLPGAWSAAVAQTAGTPTPTATATATTTTVAAGASATIQAGDDLQINIPAGATSELVEVTFQPVLDETDDPTSPSAQAAVAQALIALGVPSPSDVNSGDAVIASLFLLEAVDADGNDVTFDEPVILTFDLTPEILAAAGGNANNVVLRFFDEATQEWTAVPCSASGSTLTCELMHFSVWALLIQDEAPAQATPTAPAPADTGTGIIEGGSGSTDGVLLLVAVLGLAGVAGLGARFAVRRS